jgi:thiol-disulfide isomerase/thioredoxin
MRAICTLIVIAVLADPLLAADSAPAQEAPLEFILQNPPRAAAVVRFHDASGTDRDLSMFAGKVVLLNIWATWCVPCRAELPALDRLQAEFGGSGFVVAAVSVDRGGIDAVRKIFADSSIKRLTIYNDASGRAFISSGAAGLPVTLPIDRRGNEMARVSGPADWEAAPIRAFLRAQIQPEMEQ